MCIRDSLKKGSTKGGCSANGGMPLPSGLLFKRPKWFSGLGSPLRMKGSSRLGLKAHFFRALGPEGGCDSLPGIHRVEDFLNVHIFDLRDEGVIFAQRL